MKKTLLAAIIAATALVPPAALAQDRGRWGNRGGDQSQSSNNGPRGGGWRSERAQAQPQAEPQAQPQQQRSWGGNRGDGGQARTWNRGGGDGGQRGNWRQRQPAEQVQQAAPAPQAQAPQPSRGGNRAQWSGQQRGGDRGQWNNGQQAQPQRQQQWRGTRGDGNGVTNRNRGWNDRNGANNNRGGWNSNRNNGSRWNNGWRNNNRYDWRGYRNGNRSIFRLPRYYAPSGWGYGYRRYGIGFTLNSILFGSQYWINDPYSYRLPEVDGPYRWVRYYNDALLVDIYTGEVVDTVYDIFW